MVRIFGTHRQNRYVFPTADGTTAPPKAFDSALTARQPVQWAAAIVIRLNARNASTVSGITRSFASVSQDIHDTGVRTSSKYYDAVAFYGDCDKTFVHYQR